MLLEQLRPSPITELAGLVGRADDVGEEDGGEHAVEVRLLVPHRPEESLDCRDVGLGVLQPDHVSRARDLDETRSRDGARR